jgi:hypothetical protein
MPVTPDSKGAMVITGSGITKSAVVGMQHRQSCKFGHAPDLPGMHRNGLDSDIGLSFRENSFWNLCLKETQWGCGVWRKWLLSFRRLLHLLTPTPV